MKDITLPFTLWQLNSLIGYPANHSWETEQHELQIGMPSFEVDRYWEDYRMIFLGDDPFQQHDGVQGP